MRAFMFHHNYECFLFLRKFGYMDACSHMYFHYLDIHETTTSDVSIIYQIVNTAGEGIAATNGVDC